MRARTSEDLEARLGPALRSGPPAGDDETAALVTLAVGLRDATRPSAATLPRQEFRTELAERLAVLASELEPERRAAAGTRAASRRRLGARPGRRSGRPASRVRHLAAGLVAVVVAGGAGAAIASESALPGGVLYPLKRQVEELRLSLSSPGQARGDTELAIARERLLEAEQLALAAGGADGAATDTPRLRDTLDDFGASARDGIASLTDDYADTGDATSLAAVDTFLDETVPLLERLRTLTPPSLHPLVDELLGDLGERRGELADTVAACAACREIGLVVAVPPASGPPSTPGPDASATSVPVPPGATPSAGVEGGTDGDLLDPLDPVVDPLESVVDGLLPTADPTGTPLLPLPTAVPTGLPTGLPTVSVPPVTVPGASVPGVSVPPITVSVPPLPTSLPTAPSTSSTCLLPVLGCD